MRPYLAATFLSVTSLLAMHACWAKPGDLNRCIGPDGHSVFTDKPCAEVGATVRVEPPMKPDATTQTVQVRVHVNDCARTAEALRDGMQAALVSGDVNKVAAFYTWTGTSTAEAQDIMNRLQSIVARPFVAVDLVRVHSAPEAQGDRSAGSPATTEASGIEIVQSRSPNDPTATRTELSLTRNMGCWWLHF